MLSGAALCLAGALWQAIGHTPCSCGRMERILQACEACLRSASPQDQGFLRAYLEFYRALHDHGWSFEFVPALAPLLGEYRVYAQQVAGIGDHPETARYWADLISRGASGVFPARTPAPTRPKGVPAPAIHLVSALFSFPETALCLPCHQHEFEKILADALKPLENAPIPPVARDFIRAFVHFFQRMLARGYYWGYEVLEHEARQSPLLAPYRALFLEVAMTEAAPQSAPYWAQELVNRFKEERHVASHS